MKVPILNTPSLILKPLYHNHLSQEYVNWLNDPDVYGYLETGGNYTIEMLQDFLKEVVEKDIYFWSIHLKDKGLHIGNIKIDPINERHGLAEFGIMMGRKTEWGKGYAKEASQRIIDFCFNDLSIRKITLGVVQDNKSAYFLYQNLGFETEGVCKRHGKYKGKYCNVVRMALFNPDFE